MKLLTVTPPPNELESINGYVLRLAKVNGFTTARALFNHCGIKNMPDYIRPTHKSFGVLLSKLANVTDIKTDKLCGGFSHLKSAGLYDPDRYIKYIDNKHFQCCVSCMSEAAYQRSTWDNVFSTFCFKHGQPLTDTCPHCYALFSYSPKNLGGCPRCKTSFGAMTVASTVPTSAEVAINQVNYDEQASRIANLCELICHLLNPSHAMFSPIVELKLTVDVRREIISYAYLLIHNDEARKAHCDDTSRRHISHSGKSLHDWIQQLPKWSFSAVANAQLPFIDDQSQFLSTHRLKIHNVSGVHPERHIGILEAAWLMRIEQENIYQLGQNQCLNFLSKGKKLQNNILDIRDVLALELKLKSLAGFESELTTDLLSISHAATSLLPLYAQKIPFIIKSILEKALPVFRNHHTVHWQDLLLPRDRLISLCEQALLAMPEDIVDVETVAAMFCINVNQAQCFVRYTPLLFASRCHGQYVHLSLIQRFLREHIVLNRYCLEHDIELEHAAAMIQALPIEYPKLRDIGCIVFKRTTVISSVLAEINSRRT